MTEDLIATPLASRIRVEHRIATKLDRVKHAPSTYGTSGGSVNGSAPSPCGPWNGGSDDDIWFVRDLNHDADLNDPGEGIARWASNGTVGSEFTGLYFDPTDKRRAWVNIQHPASGIDRTIEITIR